MCLLSTEKGLTVDRNLLLSALAQLQRGVLGCVGGHLHLFARSPATAQPMVLLQLHGRGNASNAHCRGVGGKYKGSLMPNFLSAGASPGMLIPCSSGTFQGISFHDENTIKGHDHTGNETKSPAWLCMLYPC